MAFESKHRSLIRHPDIQRLMDGRHHQPFSLLGLNDTLDRPLIRAFLPFCQQLHIGESGPSMLRLAGTDLFEYEGPIDQIPKHYRLIWTDKEGHRHTEIDPYTFFPSLSDFDLDLFNQGQHWHAYRILGAHLRVIDTIKGVCFSVWAPNAERVSVVGDFNRWDGRRHPMQNLGHSGIWSLFIPELTAGIPYKFELRNRDSGQIIIKADPYAQAYELRPNTASVVSAPCRFQWRDENWMEVRQNNDWLHLPMSIYEVHLGSWQRNDDNTFLDYKQLANRLVPYVKSMGFTHIELLPITEHPLDDSWGYQSLGYYAPTTRFGGSDDLRYFINRCHENDLGVFLDWVPAHFPKDEHGFIRFDGTALFEHEDPRKGEHRDWGTLIFNYGRNEVKNFLLSSAIYWLEEFHFDGLRMDAVASLLYLDYSRDSEDWVANEFGGNENLQAIDFIRELNSVTHGRFPGTVIVAEESTSWPQVTKPVWVGGLGFSMKWNMGWMHDTLSYMSKDPIHRKFYHDQLTFGMLYAFHENFVLPFSHDEVVHGKGSMLYKMPGDEWQQFANLRLLYTYLFTHPGKKLMFMGCEFGQGSEWDHHQALDWYVLDYPFHRGIQVLVRDLNKFYTSHPELYAYDFEQQGFEWIDCHDHEQSIISYLRRCHDDFILIIINFTPIARYNYRVGIPSKGAYTECLNSDSEYYGGSNVGNTGTVYSENIAWMGQPYSLNLVLPPLGGIVLKPKEPAEQGADN